jgi:hypothetical protein
MTSGIAHAQDLAEHASCAAGGSVISRVFAGSLAGQIAGALADARKSAADDGSRFGLDAALDRACILSRALGTQDAPGQSLAIGLAGTIASELDAARAAYGHAARAGTLSPAFDTTFLTHLDRARAGTQLLAGHLARARNRHADPAHRAETTPARGTARNLGLRKAGQVMPGTARLLAVAALMLPGEYRTRYAEEYLSELRDLAQSGDSRLSQLRYAVRQLLSAISMSRSLRSPRYTRTQW